MMKSWFPYVLLAFFLVGVPLYAQSGCVDSPENPTVILGLLGAAGACCGPLQRKLISVWRSRKDN
jgi:XrtJ-associated TM-motif-TM protein